MCAPAGQHLRVDMFERLGSSSLPAKLDQAVQYGGREPPSTASLVSLRAKDGPWR
jgi:hypothetical protein